MDTDAAFLRSIETDLAPILSQLNTVAFSQGILKTSLGCFLQPRARAGEADMARVEVSVQRRWVAVSDADDIGVWVYTLHMGGRP